MFDRIKKSVSRIMDRQPIKPHHHPFILHHLGALVLVLALGAGILVVADVHPWAQEPPPGPVVTTYQDVDGSGNPVPGSLRQAIADASTGYDTITFNLPVGEDPPPGGKVITLNGGQLYIDKDLTIEGPGAEEIAVSGDRKSMVFHSTGPNVAISGLEIKEAQNEDWGGGIYNEYGTLTLTDSIVRDNFPAYGAGGITNYYGTAKLERVSVSGNFSAFGPGGIESHGGYLTIEDSTVSGNTSPGGGSIGAGAGGTLTITNSTIRGNTGNSGTGGIFTNFATVGAAKIINSTISDNTAGQEFAGGLHNAGQLTIINSTIYNNTGPDADSIYNQDLGRLTLKNTIVASPQSGPPNCFNNATYGATVTSEGSNLEDGDSCEFSQSTDQTNTNPLLGPLADNGGPTWTHALLTGSPAIDKAVAVEGITTDQRGVTRPQGAAPDIGAFELESDTTPPAAPALDLDSSSDSGSSNTDNITKETRPKFVGTAEADSTVEIFDGETSLVTTTVDSSGNWSVTPSSALSEGVHQITAKATDQANNISDPSGAVKVTIDTTAPTVSSTSPANNATNVANKGPITATFSDKDGAGNDGSGVEQGTLTDQTFQLWLVKKRGNEQITQGSVSCDANPCETATYALNSGTTLTGGTYQATITTGVKDLAGNALASDYTWQFKVSLNQVNCPSSGGACGGTSGADLIIGSPIADSIRGYKGDDIAYGNAGNDKIDGDPGNDKLRGDAGNDTISGVDDSDVIDAARIKDPTAGTYALDTGGEDWVYGGTGADVIDTVDGKVDHIKCGDGADTIYYDEHDVFISSSYCWQSGDKQTLVKDADVASFDHGGKGFDF